MDFTDESSVVSSRESSIDPGSFVLDHEACLEVCFDAVLKKTGKATRRSTSETLRPKSADQLYNTDEDGYEQDLNHGHHKRKKTPTHDGNERTDIDESDLNVDSDDECLQTVDFKRRRVLPDDADQETSDEISEGCLDEVEGGEDPDTKAARLKSVYLDDDNVVFVEGKETEFLKRRVEDRLAGQKSRNERAPRNIVEDGIAYTDSEPYRAALKLLLSSLPTQEQKNDIKLAKTIGPNYLGRTASLVDGNRFNKKKRATNGFTAQNIMMPAADTHEDEGVHKSLLDLSQGELILMLGHHLMWLDRRADEFLSYSIDPLFLIVHALNRAHEGQQDVTIQLFDRRTAETIDRKPAAFYPALKLYEAFDLYNQKGWTGIAKKRLYARKFTQEYLSHGTIIVNDNRFKPVPIGTPIRDGLYDLFPAFDVPEDHERAGLYSGQVVFRRIGYPTTEAGRSEDGDQYLYSYTQCCEPVPFTIEALETASRIAKNFTNDESAIESEEKRPHLHTFLFMLTFVKRLARDPVLLDWVKPRYTKEDVLDLYDNGKGGVQPEFTHVASNLPGVRSYNELVDDMNFAFGLPELPETKIETENAKTGEKYEDNDAKLQKNEKASKDFDEPKQRRKRELANKRRETKQNRAVVESGVVDEPEDPASISTVECEEEYGSQDATTEDAAIENLAEGTEEVVESDGDDFEASSGRGYLDEVEDDWS